MTGSENLSQPAAYVRGMKWIVPSIVVAALLGLTAQAQRRESGPAVGSDAPQFELKMLHTEDIFRLQDNFGVVPTVLIFGSYT